MSAQHRRIPLLPKRPVSKSLATKITRSYPVGRKNSSRACKGKVLTLTISTEEKLPESIRANILTTMNSKNCQEWEKIPFERLNDFTLVCKIKPKFAGLHSFRAEFSLDNGKSWIRDTVSDAWVLVDPRQVDGLRLYTLIPAVSGTIADWQADLQRIKQMGFNAVHLLPITKQDSSKSPYSANDLFEIEPTYLNNNTKADGWQQLEAFIETAKELNIKLIFDLVLNHIGVHSNIANQAPDWIVPGSDQPDGFKRAGYWCDKGWLYWDDLVLINYEHPSRAIRAEIWNYMMEYALFWAKYANYTEGFIRFDNLHSSNPEFVEALTIKLQEKYPNVGIIAEYFTDSNTLLHTVPKWGLNMCLATPWDYKFVPQLRDYLKHIHQVSIQVRYFMPVTSHDSGTPAQEFGNAAATIPRYVSAALMGTGASGIVQGVEYAWPNKIDFIGKHPKLKFPDDAMYSSFITRVNEILSGFPAFRRGGNCKFVDNNHDAIIACFRKSTSNNIYGFLIVSNFDIGASHNITIDLTDVIQTNEPVTYCELLNDTTGVYTKPLIDLSLQPSSAKVLMLTEKQQVVNPLLMKE